MDLRKIKKLIEMLQESDLNEIEVKEGEESVRINRKKESIVHTSVSPSIVPSPVAQNNPPTTEETTESEISDDNSKIVSPMVGTFYRKPSPDKDNFVEIGDQISEGQTLCVIEAMKLFNEIESDISGKIVKVLVDDATPVEFDQPLFLVEP